MVTKAGKLFASFNSGEIGPDAEGRIDIDQREAAARMMRGFEPVPQSGFRLMPQTRFWQSFQSNTGRVLNLEKDGAYVWIVILPGEFHVLKDGLEIASGSIPTVTADIIGEIAFYAELNTVGIFHRTIRSIRLLRNNQDDTLWSVDDWPYESIPLVDLGGTYPTTDDQWTVYLNYISVADLVIEFSVNGEVTQGIPLNSNPTAATTTDFEDWASRIQTAIRDLPSLNDDVEVTIRQGSGQWQFQVVFGGSLSGSAYNLEVRIVNTAEASALPTHIVVGDTEGEPLYSDTQGYPGSASLVQDRLSYCDFPARAGSFSLSQSGEYFSLNIEQTGSDAARLDAIRTETSERVLRVVEATFMLVFTNRNVWFASNRVIDAEQSLNLVSTSDAGLREGTTPVDLEGLVYFVGNDGEMVYSLSYDELQTSFSANPDTLLSNHLITGIIRTAVQRGNSNTDANRFWVLRDDGLLINNVSIRSQNILAPCRWPAFDNGQVIDMSVGADNTMVLLVLRDGALNIEVMEPDLLFQATRTRTPDLAGLVSELEDFEGKTVWADADGYICGPFTVENGQIDLGFPASSADVGLWEAPYLESPPRVNTNQFGEVIPRPGRIHTVHARVIDTQSIAIGANGRAPRNVPLMKSAADLTIPFAGTSGQYTQYGLLGAKIDTTFVITQLRPGKCHVRDVVIEEKL